MDGGVELEFSDGKRLVDTPIADLINRATEGHPERFTFRDAQALIGPQMTNDLFRKHIRGIRADHLRQHGG